MSRTKLTLAVLAIAAAIGIQAAFAQVEAPAGGRGPLTTGGRWQVITDTLALRGGAAQAEAAYRLHYAKPAPSGTIAPAESYRLLNGTPAASGTIAPAESYRLLNGNPGRGGDGSPGVSTGRGLGWRDTAIGAGAAALALVLLAGSRLLVRRRRVLAA